MSYKRWSVNTFLRFLLFFIFILIALLAWEFTEQNAEKVPLWLWKTFPEQKVGIWIIEAFITGGILGLILGFGLMARLRNRWQINRLRKKTAQVQQPGLREKGKL